MADMIDAIAAGHLCVDIMPQISDPSTAASGNFLSPGRLTEMGGAIVSPGGSVSNTGQAMHVLGLDVRLVARVGDDLFGDLLMGLVQVGQAGARAAVGRHTRRSAVTRHLV